MNAVSMLEGQHRRVEGLFEAYQAAEEAPVRRRLFLQLADAISAHTEVEEELFYPAVYFGEAKELLELALEDHQSVKVLLDELLDSSPDSAAFEARMIELQETIVHHIEEEESSLFLSVRTAFTLDELEALGTRLEARLRELQLDAQPDSGLGPSGTSTSSPRKASESSVPKPNSEA